MEPFTHFQNMNEAGSNDSIFGGIFLNQSGLDTTIGLKHDADIGQINSLFDEIKNKKDEVKEIKTTEPDDGSRNKRDIATSAASQENNGNNTIWIIVGVIFVILVIVAFVFYIMNKRKNLADRTKTIYSNISNKLSSLRSNTKNTVID